jgi:hypothetical protein
VQALDQALIQASIVGSAGGARMLPSLISPMVLSHHRHPQRHQEQHRGHGEQRIDAGPPDAELARARTRRLDERAHRRPSRGRRCSV